MIVLLWACQRGTRGPNRFGPDPLGEPSAPWGQAPDAAPQPTHPARAEPRDLIGELERLAQLKAAGGLSEAEYEVMKARTLAGVRFG